MPNKQSDIAGGFAAEFLTRKQFLKTLGASSFPGRVQAAPVDPVAPEPGAKDRSAAVPSYLKGYRRINELYAFIRSLQPQCMVSFKQGTGTEDFVVPEGLMHVKGGLLAEQAWAMNAVKRGDICSNLQTAPPSWLYLEGCQHLTAGQVLAVLADAFSQKANLTINTGLLPDGSIHPDDVAALREAGERIRKSGFPEPKAMDRGERRKGKKKTP